MTSSKVPAILLALNQSKEAFCIDVATILNAINLNNRELKDINEKHKITVLGRQLIIYLVKKSFQLIQCVGGISYKKKGESELNASYYTESIEKISSLIK